MWKRCLLYELNVPTFVNLSQYTFLMSCIQIFINIMTEPQMFDLKLG